MCIHVISSLAWDGISHSPYTCLHITALAMVYGPRTLHSTAVTAWVEWSDSVEWHWSSYNSSSSPGPLSAAFSVLKTVAMFRLGLRRICSQHIYIIYCSRCKGQIFDQSCREMNCTNDCNESPDANTLTAHCHASHNQYWTWSLPNKLVKICLHPVKILLKDIRRLRLKVFTCVLWTTFMTIIRKWQMLIEGFFGRQQRQTKVDRGWQRTAKTEGGSQM